MPQPFNNAVITNSGARLLTRAQAGELKIEFTRIAVGNGEYTEDEKSLSALQIQTDLKASQNSYPISDLEVYSDYSVKVTALITNLDPVTGKTLVNAGYFINEMGLFAKEKDGEPDTEVLYSIAVTVGDNGDFMPPYNGYNPAQITQEYFATVNNSSEVYIQTAGAAALAEDVMSIRQDVERLKQNGAAGQYSDQIQYHAGEYCIHEGILYKCIQDTAGEWNPEYWQKTSPMEEIENLKKEISGQISMIDSLSNILGTDQSGELDWVMQGGSSSKAGKSGLVPAPGKGKQNQYLKGDATWENMDDHTVDFTISDNRENISARDKIKTILGKIAKVFSDMGAAAYCALANNLATTEEGFAMDARVGPVIDERFVDIETQLGELNSALENLGAGYLFHRQIKTTSVTTQVGKWTTVTLRGFSVPDGYNIFSVYFQANISAISILLVDQDKSLVQFRVYTDAQYNATITVNRICVKNNLIKDYS